MMLTFLQRAAIEYCFAGPNARVSAKGTITFQPTKGGPRATERDPAYLTQLSLEAEATVAKIAGLDRAKHLDALRGRQVTEEMVEYIANHWDSFDAYEEMAVFQIAQHYALNGEASTVDAGDS